MCFALAIACRRQCDAVYFDFGEKGAGDAEGEVTLCIQPQVQLGRYRVDFLVTIQTIRPIGDCFDVTRSQVIIECDGHDFHDRTTEQALRDRSRDRELQLMGFQVFRYAGAEIWRDVFACAEEVLPISPLALTFAPASTKASMSSRSPTSAARCSSVSPITPR
jgi:very-short-patch-repair endonuclease